MAHPKHQAVRQRYQYRCGYCGVSETDTGGELTVDHYHPTSAGGDDSDDNLVYACFRCNLYKSDIIADAASSGRDVRLLHPLLDEIGAHLRENTTTGRLEAMTERGRIHLTALRLNRAELIAHRQETRLRSLLAEQLNYYAQVNAQLRQEIEQREELIVRLKEQSRLKGEVPSESEDDGL